jgi:hypothetical protein
MRVRVADPTGRYEDQNVGWADFWECNIGLFQWLANLYESYRFHRCLTRACERCIDQRMCRDFLCQGARRRKEGRRECKLAEKPIDRRLSEDTLWKCHGEP